MHQELVNDLLQNHISHAYLLIGKKEKTLKDATDFALALNCKTEETLIGCGHCRNCRLGKDNCFCDFTMIEPEKETYTVKEIRNFVKIAQFAPQEGKYRIFLLYDIDKMREEAANTMLKTIEEPAPNTVILLLAENADKILETILSRCRILRYGETIEELSNEDLDKAFHLLTTIPHQSMDMIFSMGESYTAKNRDALRILIYAIEEILSRNYRVRHTEERNMPYLFEKDGYKEAVILSLWGKATEAAKRLEYQVNPRLIADTLFLAIKEENGGH